jgi:hypothetical protein
MYSPAVVKTCSLHIYLHLRASSLSDHITYCAFFPSSASSLFTPKMKIFSSGCYINLAYQKVTLFFNLPLQNEYFLLKCRRVYESRWTTTWKSSLLRRTQSPLCEQNNQRSHLALTIFAHLDDSIISSRRWQHSIFSFFTRHIFYATRALIFCHCSAVWLQTAGLRLFVLCFVCCASDSKTHPPIKDDIEAEERAHCELPCATCF